MNKNNTFMSTAKGITCIDLVFFITLLGLFFAISIPRCTSFFNDIHFKNELYKFKNAFQTARLQSITQKINIRLKKNNQTLFLQQSINHDWQTFKHIEIDSAIQFAFSSTPVFLKNGCVTPTTSVYIQYKNKHSKISISMNGRIKCN
jgi:Tfp pilus assembly protein FimT